MAASPGRSRCASGDTSELGSRLTALAECAVLLVSLALQAVERDARLPAQIGPAERQHVFAVVVRVLEPAEVDQRQHLLGDRHRAALEPDDVAGELLAGGRE